MKFSNTKGITLISLVVTIIVMIILAGVAISNIVGDNSSIDKAEVVKEKEERASKKDKIQFAITKYNSQDYVVETKDFSDFLDKELDISKNRGFIEREMDKENNKEYYIVKLSKDDVDEFEIKIDETGFFYIAK